MIKEETEDFNSEERRQSPYPSLRMEVGFVVGQGNYQDLKIAERVKLFCFLENKGCRLDPSSSGERKLFRCTDSHCEWSLSICKNRRTNVW